MTPEQLNNLSALADKDYPITEVETAPPIPCITVQQCISSIKIRQREAFIAGYQRAVEWYPMETAPKDGTHILVNDSNEGVMLVCWDIGNRFYGKKRNAWCVPGSEQDEQGGSYISEYPLTWCHVPIPQQLPNNLRPALEECVKALERVIKDIKNKPNSSRYETSIKLAQQAILTAKNALK